MKTRTVTVFSAHELKPQARARAFSDWARNRTFSFGCELRQALKWCREKAEAFPAGLSFKRRCAWVENNINGPLRLVRSIRKYGPAYYFGKIAPFPLTGFWFDEDLLAELRARILCDAPISRILRALDRVAEETVDSDYTEEVFLEEADANDWEFLPDGQLF